MLPEKGLVDVWETATRRCLFRVHRDNVRSVAFSSDERWLLVGGETGGGIWELSTGELRCVLDWISYALRVPLFTTFDSLDATVFLAASDRVLQFDVVSGTLL